MNLCLEYGEAPELPKLLAKGTDLLTCGAPCMIVLHSPDDCLNPVLDAAVGMAQLELLLVHKGLGTCWAAISVRSATGSRKFAAIWACRRGTMCGAR